MSAPPQVELPFRSVLIHGMGMMGASLARSLRACKSRNASEPPGIVGAVRSEKSAAFIRAHKLADEIHICSDEREIAKLPLADFDLIVLGTPVHSVVRTAASLPRNTSALITDMASTRREIQAAFAERSDLRFVGSHPMCGSENRGPTAAVPDLFQNSLCIITPLDHSRATDVALTARLWEALEMRTCVLSGDRHDEVLAYLSHGPHLLSGLLTLWAQNEAVREAFAAAPMPITGGGFKGMARIAGSNPEMWTDILLSNRDYLRESLNEFRGQLDQLLEMIARGERADWLDWFSEARRARNELCGYPAESSDAES